MYDDSLCVIVNLCFNPLAAAMAASAPLFKTYRVAIIFEKALKLQSIQITDRQLLFYIAAAVFIEIVICTVYSVLHQWYGGVEREYYEDDYRTEWTCNQNQTVCGSILFLPFLVIIRWSIQVIPHQFT